MKGWKNEWKKIGKLLADKIDEKGWIKKHKETEVKKRLATEKKISIFSHLQGKSIPEEDRQAWADTFEVSVYELYPYLIDPDTQKKDMLTGYISKIFSKLTKLHLCCIFSDLEYNDFIFNNYIVKDIHAGGALSAVPEAVKSGFLPVICSAVCNDDWSDFVEFIEKEYPECITDFIGRKLAKTNHSRFDFSKEVRDKFESDNKQKKFHTELDHSEIKELIQMSGISSTNDGIIFIHTFQMFRLIGPCEDIYDLSKVQIEKRKRILEEYMNAFRTVGEKQNLFVILQLGPSLTFHDRIRDDEIKTILGYCDMVDIDIRIAVKVLREKLKELDIKSVDTLKKKHLDLIIDQFLGVKKGDTLLIRFGGVDYLNRLLIFQRKTKEEYLYYKSVSEGFISYQGDKDKIFSGVDTKYESYKIKSDKNGSKREIYDQIERITDLNIREIYYNKLKRFGYEERVLFENLSTIMKSRNEIMGSMLTTI
jgi:hypothetical protein